MLLVPFIFRFKMLKPEENCLNLERDSTELWFFLVSDPTVTGHGLCSRCWGRHQGQGNWCDSFLPSVTQLAKDTTTGVVRARQADVGAQRRKA